jgi:ABC-type Fe3+/spermidine/putrescine transport system ATPase subunit
VAENIGFGLVERRVARPEIARRVTELLELIRLPALGERFPHELSGGQQQRVALARALACSPRVLLMDEPLGALDLKLREALQDELRRVQRELGITTIFVTHDQGEAMSLADRIVVMSDGAIEQVGTPEQLYHTPATSFVAGFIGKTTLIHGKLIERRGDDARVALPDGAIFTGRCAGAVNAGEAVTLAIRPEAFRIIDGTQQFDGNRLAGTVTSRRFLGTTTYYVVAGASGREYLVARPATDAPIAPGAPVEIGCAAAQTLVLPR